MYSAQDLALAVVSSSLGITLSEPVSRNLMHVRLSRSAGAQETYFLGPASECPPIPRIGETVDLQELCGLVTGLTHAMETIGEHVVYHVEIEVDAVRGLQGAS